MAQNTVALYGKILRSALNKAAAKNIINHNPATSVSRVPTVDTDMVFLNISEIQKLADTKMDNPYGAEIRRAFLFACYTGLRVSDAEHKREASYNYLAEWAEKAKIKKHIGWHTARRTFATLALENGVNPITVAKLLGHKNLDQVMKYAKATDRLKREAIAALPEVNL